MIQITKLNGAVVYINPDLLLMLEMQHDTRMVFTTVSMLLAQEPAAEIVQRIAAYRRSLLREKATPGTAFKLIRFAEDA